MNRGGLRSALPLIALLAVFAVAIGLRLANLAPPERGLLFAADPDEGMHAFDASLALAGYLPYRDYLCSIPPLSLYLFMAILGPTSHLWGAEAAFMILRYISVLYGLATILIVYALGARLGGRAAGLLAAALLACDGWAVAQDRRFMVEPPMNMLSALAVLVLVETTLRRKDTLRWPALAGALASMAMLTKTQGLVVPAVVVLTLLLLRRWRQATVALVSAVGVYLLFSLPFLLAAPDDFVRNLFVFQFLRPPNGDPALMLRVNAIRNFAESWLTVRLGLLGAGVLVLRFLWSATNPSSQERPSPPTPLPTAGEGSVWSATNPSSQERSTPPPVVAGQALTPNPSPDRRRGEYVERDDSVVADAPNGWLPVIVWLILVIALFASSKSFYLYYYAQLAVPLALLGGSLLDRDMRGRPGRALAALVSWAPRLAIVVAIAFFAIWRGPVQLQATIQGTRWVKTAYVEMGRYLKQNTPEGAPVLAFEPNYVFLGERRLARLADGAFPVDIHASMLYINLDIKQRTWGSLLNQIIHRQMVDEQTLLWQKPAQDAVLGADAQYVIIDYRARYVLSPDTLQAIEKASDEVVQFSGVSLRKMR